MICYLVQCFTLTSLFRKKNLSMLYVTSSRFKTNSREALLNVAVGTRIAVKMSKKNLYEILLGKYYMNFLITILQGFFLIQELLRHLFYTYMEDNSAMYNVCRMKDRVTRPWFYK